MQKSLTPRFLTIGVILAWAVYALLPTWEYQQMTEEEKEKLRTLGELEKTESRIIRQGLDLKGGMYIVLEADIPLLVSNLASMKDDRLNKIIDDSKEKSIKQNQDFISVFDTEVRNDGIKLSRYYHEYGASLDQIITSLNEEADDAINRVLEILQNRVDQFGVSEPTIQKQGKHRIVVELAGIQDSDRARALLQSTALLEFYLVKNVSVTNEVIAQLDNALKGDQNLASSLKDDTKETNEVDKEESTTVSELFGEEQVTPNESTENEDFDDDIFLENPFSGLLAAIPGDMGVEEVPISAAGKKVVIIGGGDTGADCLGTAHRQGASSVHQFEIMARPPEERSDGNPWPTFPMTFKTTSAHEEGGERIYSVNTEKFVGDEDGNVRALAAHEVEFKDGRFEKVPGSDFELEADAVFLAMGFTGPEKGDLLTQLGVDLDERSNVARDSDFSTNVDGVWVCGDMGRGQSLIVWAIAEGRSCAASVDAFLTGSTALMSPVAPTDRPLN